MPKEKHTRNPGALRGMGLKRDDSKVLRIPNEIYEDIKKIRDKFVLERAMKTLETEVPGNE